MKAVLSPPISENSREMPSKGCLPVCPFHTRSLLIPCLLLYSQFFFLPTLELKAILGVWAKSTDISQYSAGASREWFSGFAPTMPRLEQRRHAERMVVKLSKHDKC